jgi:hypothetical protein
LVVPSRSCFTSPKGKVSLTTKGESLAREAKPKVKRSLLTRGARSDTVGDERDTKSEGLAITFGEARFAREAQPLVSRFLAEREATPLVKKSPLLALREAGEAGKAGEARERSGFYQR